MISDPLIRSRMQYKITVTVILLLCAVIAFTGCTLPSGPGSAGTATGGPSPGAGSAANNLVPSTTDVVPDQNAITVTVKEKDYLGKIPVVFDGGMGQIHVRKIEATLYRSDGQVQTSTIGINKEDSIELDGTKQDDRVVVYVTFDNGQRLKTNDVISPYRTRG
jgi:hypothetical protein